MTLPKKERSWDFDSSDVSMGCLARGVGEALGDTFDFHIEMMLKKPLTQLRFTYIVSKPQRVVVIERHDGRHCWLSVGKKQVLNVGPSGYVMFSEGCRLPTLCGDRPYIVKPASKVVVTCLACLANGVPPHLQ